MFHCSNPFPFGCLLSRELSSKGWFRQTPGRINFKEKTIATARPEHAAKLRNYIVESGQKANIVNEIRRDHMRRDRTMEVKQDLHIRKASALSSGGGLSLQNQQNVPHKARVAANNMAMARQELAKAQNVWAERHKSRNLHVDEARKARRDYSRDRRNGASDEGLW